MTKTSAIPEDKKNIVKDRIKGVFSTQVLTKVGTGTTLRKTIQKSYWFANELEDGAIEVQPLNVNYVPSGPKNTLGKDEFLDKFSPEPEFYTVTVMPKIREMEKSVARGDRHRKRGESFSAEFEYNNAVKVDEENVRANFGLGLTYLERGEKDKAQDIFDRLVKIQAAYEPEHKHLFNDFGISLRKNKMIDQAIVYYDQALSLSQNDENLYYNIARVYLESQNIPKTIEMLKKALEINPEMPEATKFLDFLKNKGLVSQDS
ncbi:Tetratricopeptide repeat-containing protein [Desulfonatronum thiosulfatophilum]|uniref:Tetratricopeptide repeat-containing protein n=1 Tax=Desulfonatronum thiosulfatophilum TaxID=617002 RepID=A0A1G6BYK6_9BACT|nr:tetratricopeptide repeat protein [Desulfonatronum thiosulfatophilum]SDB25667.1 Tetratricopeptide repeat-containing protein [Desulfonatronum thiosulfatophilum]